MWQRIPAELKQRSAILQPIWTIITPLLQHNPPLFFSHFAQLALPPSYPILPALLAALLAHTRHRSLVSIEESYATIADSEAKRLLGITDTSQWSELIQQRGWLVEDGWVRPKHGTNGAADGDVGYNELRQLTEYIVQLER